mmetsp:Transcript_3055/g.2630  ORF Transcript_3055/g.2630 Transcript_3055/m.2630 type:complete len:126 (+) Transcript_3055:99-476(+)
MFMNEFEDKLHDIMNKFELVQKCCETLLEEEGFHMFLKFCLEFGNMLNKGTIRADAKAFSLLSINTLLFTRSKGPYYLSVFEYIMNKIYHHYSSIFTFLSKFDIFNEADKINTEELSQQITSLKR